MAEKPSHPQGVPEPFGQIGVRQFLVPTVSLLLLFIACFSAVMWMRSYDTQDFINRRIANSTWQIYSINGRIIAARTDYRTMLDPAAMGDTSWQYSSLPVPDGPPDHWKPSWMKTIGVEWRAEPISRQPIVLNGWWLRVRWRTVTLLAVIMPVTRAILHQLRNSRRRRRGVDAVPAPVPAPVPVPAAEPAPAAATSNAAVEPGNTQTNGV